MEKALEPKTWFHGREITGQHPRNSFFSENVIFCEFVHNLFSFMMKIFLLRATKSDCQVGMTDQVQFSANKAINQPFQIIPSLLSRLPKSFKIPM